MKLRSLDIISYLIYLAFFGFGIIAGLHNTLAYIALCLSLLCAALWFVARWQLGEAFSVTAQAHQLVTQGLYSKIRHPIYVFGTLAFLFVVLALQGWPALTIWAIVIPIPFSMQSCRQSTWAALARMTLALSHQRMRTNLTPASFNFRLSAFSMIFLSGVLL